MLRRRLNPLGERNQEDPILNPRRSFLSRMYDTYLVFRGNNYNEYWDSEAKKRVPYKWYQVPLYKNFGIVSLLVGGPAALVAKLFDWTRDIGKLLLKGARKVFKFATQSESLPLKILGGIVTSPVWLTMGIVGAGLAIAGGLAGGLYHPVNLLVQKVAVPLISMLAAVAISPITAIVHLAIKLKGGGRPRQYINIHDSGSYENMQDTLGKGNDNQLRRSSSNTYDSSYSSDEDELQRQSKSTPREERNYQSYSPKSSSSHKRSTQFKGTQFAQQYQQQDQEGKGEAVVKKKGWWPWRNKV